MERLNYIVLDKHRNIKNIIKFTLILTIPFSILFLFLGYGHLNIFDLYTIIFLFFVFLIISVIIDFIKFRNSDDFLMDIICVALHEEKGWDNLAHILENRSIHSKVLQQPVSMFIIGNCFINKNLEKEGMDLIQNSIEKEPELKKIKLKKRFERKDSEFLFNLRQKNKKRPSKIGIKSIDRYIKKGVT